MSRFKINHLDWCNPDRVYREPLDFFDRLVTLFDKPVEPPPNTVYDENSLVDAIERKTVKDVMQALSYFNKYHKKDKVMIDKIYDHLVKKRELWYAKPNPIIKTPRVIMVAEHTPWRYFHDVFRRQDFTEDKFVLVSIQKARYYIWMESRFKNQRIIQELGICDEHFTYQRCDCDFTRIQVLCSRCNAYVEDGQCTSDVTHKFPWANIRCFRFDHGKLKPAGDGEYVDTKINVNIKDSADTFDRADIKRKSSRKKKSPKVSPVQELPPTYQEYEETRKSPQIHPEEHSKHPFIPDSLKNPYHQDEEYGRPQIIGDRGTPPVVTLKPPAPVVPVRRKESPPQEPPLRIIPVRREDSPRESPTRIVPSKKYDPSFEEPPHANLPDEIHKRPVEGKYSPIPGIPEEGSENQDLGPKPYNPYEIPIVPLRERPGNIPQEYRPTGRESSSKIVEIPIERIPPKSPGIMDSERYSPIKPQPVPYDYPPIKHQPPSYDYPPDSPENRASPRRSSPEIPPPVLPPRTPADFNVLIMGPTGVGKSTWINALANYLRYNTLADAKNNQLFDVIPVKFRVQDKEWNEYSVSYGKMSENEQHIPGQSNTQRPQQYVFSVGRNNVNIIDTPGVTDTRGLAQDEINCQMILEEIGRIRPPQIHALAIVLKSNESRLGAALEQAIISLLSLLPKSATKNLVFFFTYARGTMFRIGDTYNALAKLFDQIEERHGTRIILSRESVYCVDNEAYRYLVVCAQKDPKLEDCMLNFEEYEDSWHKSQHESTRFFDHLCNIRPLETTEVTAYNAIKKVAEELAKLILADEDGPDAYKLAYEVVIDYLIQYSIIITDPLMREIIRTKRAAPEKLEKKYFVDHRPQRSEVTKEEVYRYLKEFQSVPNISSEFINSIQHYITVYEVNFRNVIVEVPNTGHVPRNTESFNEYDLAYGPGETTYSCLEEKRTVITESVHYFDSRPQSFISTKAESVV